MLYPVKGRCIGVSLCNVSAQYYKKDKIIESLPESMIGLETPQCTCKKASFTVEAALVLPLLACFFSCILFFFQIMQVQLSVQKVLEDTGRRLAVLASTETKEDIAYESVAKLLFYVDLKEQEEVEKFVVGGALGIVLIASESEGDYVSLEVNYGMKFPINLLGKQVVWINQKAFFRKWTGWHVKDITCPENVWVYVTPNGSAYHQRKSCPYLALSIREVELSEVRWLRNLDGTRYRECKSCMEKKGGKVVYLTDYGERYHYDLACGGLKRTIYTRRLSEVENRDACTKCWK